MNTPVKTPRLAIHDDGGHTRHGKTVSSVYIIPLLREFARSDVHVHLAGTAPIGPCVHCQRIDAVCEVHVDWTPRADVASDGTAECCIACAVSVIRRAVDDSPLDRHVDVEISAG